MYVFTALSCLAVLLHSSASIPLADNKPKAVNLDYMCIKVTSGGSKSIDQTPVILIHGLGLSKESWMGIYELIAMRTSRKVCIVDLRNHGNSPWSDEADVATMTEDISKVLDSIETPKVILLGHSLGGKVAMHFTLNYPDKVEKLIVEDMRPNTITLEALLGVKYFLKLLVSSIDAIPDGADEGMARKAVAQFLKNELAKVNSTSLLDERTVQFLPIACSEGKCRWKTNIKLFGQIQKDFHVFWNESSGRFDGPSLFLYGTKSPFKVKEDESSILKLFPQAKLVGIEGAGHIVHVRREYLDEVIKFINKKKDIDRIDNKLS